MDRRIESKTWTGRRLSILLLVAALAAGAAALLVHLSTTRLQVERDKLTVATVRRGRFQEYVLVAGEVRAGAAGSEVRAAVNRHDALRLAVGQRGETEARGRTLTLEITRLGSIRGHDVKVDLGFTPRTSAVAPGERLSIRLALEAASEALLLSRGAFFQTTGGHWVWVVDEAKGRAVRRDVRLGRQNPEVYEILSGLTLGERVITSTYDHLDGADELILAP